MYSYDKYLRSKHWRDTRKYSEVVSGKVCLVCKKSTGLHLHHRHYKTKGYEDGSELVWLCAKHHRTLHYEPDGTEIIPDSEEQIAFLDAKLNRMRGINPKKLKEPTRLYVPKAVAPPTPEEIAAYRKRSVRQKKAFTKQFGIVMMGYCSANQGADSESLGSVDITISEGR